MSDDTIRANLTDLEAQLFRIPEEDLTKLVTELEQRQQDRGKAPTVNKIMDQLRPRLAIMRPKRQPSLVRFFAEPFSDLLYTSGEPRKPVGRIPRHAIVPCFELLVGHADGNRIKRYQDDLDEATKSGDETAMMQLGTGFWRYAAAQLRKVVATAEANSGAKKSLIDEFGDPNLFAALKEIVGVLEVAVPVMQLRRALPASGMKQVTNSDMEAICTALDEVHHQRPANTEFVVFVILARLHNPATIVEIMQRAEEAGTIADVSAVTSIANEAIVSQTEAKIRQLEEKIAASSNARDLALQTEIFVREILGAARAVGNKGSRQQARQVERTKSEIAALIRREMLEALDGTVASCLGIMAAEETSSGRDAVSAQKSIEDRIVSLRVMDRFAADLGLEKEVGKRFGILEAAIKEQSTALLAALRSRNGIGADLGEAQRRLYALVRMTELLAGSEKADQLRMEGIGLLQAY